MSREQVAVSASSSKGASFIFSASALAILAVLAVPVVGLVLEVYNSKRERHRLVHATDHAALLEAARTMMLAHAGQHIDDPANDARVPQIIRGLGPSYIDISSEQLKVELHGGFEHYGFIAYAEGAEESDRRGKLIDGLFYYTD